MGFMDLLRSEGRTEKRDVSQSTENFFQKLAGNGVVLFGGGQSAGGVSVTIENALTVPAVASVVNFIPATIAGLPLNVYRRAKDSRTKSNSRLATLLHDAPNPYVTSFEWRKQLFTAKLTGGRGLSYIERREDGTVEAIWPLDPDKMTVKRDRYVNTYEYNDNGRKIRYSADEIIDLPFLLKSDGFSHRSPIVMGKEAIGLALAVNQYGSKYLSNGGVPPFAVTGNFQSGASLDRAANDLAQAVKKAAGENRQFLTLPSGLEIKEIGANPEQSQMVETQRFCVEEIARLYNVPPTFLQDLTHGTYSNTEQQDLHFVKHTLKQHIEQFEQELNLKLFGQTRRASYVELNMDGLLRGDFKTRMEGYARGIQTGQITPNEARRGENRPDAEGGDKLYMQGATVPIEQTGENNDD